MLDPGAAEVRKHTRIYFPSKHTVRNSIAKVSRQSPLSCFFETFSSSSYLTNGTILTWHSQDAGTICFQKQWFEASTFPREVLRDCISTRPGMLMHDKMIFVRKTEESKDEPGKKVVSGFAYVGSANMSESAW